MTDKLPDVWTWRDYPVLLAIAREVDTGGWIGAHELSTQTGLSIDDCCNAVRALEVNGYVLDPSYSSGPDASVGKISGKAYAEVGLHPDVASATAALIKVLEDAAERTPDPAEKSQLRAAALAVGNVGGQFLANVLAAFAAKMAGIS